MDPSRPIELIKSTVINEVINKGENESKKNSALEILKNKSLDKAQKKTLAEVVAHQIYSEACEIKDDIEKKILFLKTAAKIGSPDACYKLANFYAKKEEYKKRYKCLKDAIKIEPNHWNSKYQLGEIFLDSDNNDKRILGKIYIKESIENGLTLAVRDSIKNAKNKGNFQKVVNLLSQENYIKKDEELYELALILEEHPEVKSNYKSHDLILTSSNNGHPRSILKLINNYIVEGNIDETMRWCDKIDKLNNLSPIEKFELAKLFTSTLKYYFPFMSISTLKSYRDKAIVHLRDNIKNNHSQSIELLMKFDPEFKKIKEIEYDEKRLQFEAECLDYISANVKYHPIELNMYKFFFIDVLCPKNTSIDYPNLHANKISVSNLHFIAAQFPKINQISYFIDQCIKQTNLVVNLTNEDDKNKYQLEDYFKDCHFKSINCSIAQVVTKEGSNLIFSENYIQRNDDLNNIVLLQRIQYTGWPDGEFPDSKELKNLIERVLDYGNSENHRITVHCVAGVGRTATFIVACALYKYIQENKSHFTESSITSEIILKVLKGFITDVRTQRGNGSINQKQIVFLFNWGRSLANNEI
ncbi:MAG: protein-tyrosine phosphatase family protein [Parachlamydiaceae bacterium]|nr:protein-tyrosine phosphatase family protein [Parachlamydiaceae bacterium]